MLSKPQLEKLLSTALSKGGDFADIFIEDTSQTSITFEDDKLDKLDSGIDAGCGIRVIDGTKTYYACTQDPNYEPLLQQAEQLAASVNRSKKAKISDLKPVPPGMHAEGTKRPAMVHINDKISLIEKSNSIARSYGSRIKQVTIRYIDTNQAVSIANSLGTYVEDNRIRTRFAVNVVAAKDGIFQTALEGPGGTMGFEFFDKYDHEKIARTAAERALLMLDAEHAPTGKMTVVLSSEAGGTMVHEACGHALEADFIHKGTSVFANKIGQKVAADIVSVVDDATIPGNYGSFRFDDEGTPAQKKLLIENGILKGFMSDRYNAELLSIIPSGNGRRESFRTKPIPRMTNTFIQAGMTDPQEIISSVKKGLLVKKMGGGEVNVTNGDFVFEIMEAYLIENGKVIKPVRGAMLIGNGPEVLKMIDMVGWDLGFQPGTCGKFDHAPVTHGQPTIRIPEITVGGRS